MAAPYSEAVKRKARFCACILFLGRSCIRGDTVAEQWLSVAASRSQCAPVQRDRRRSKQRKQPASVCIERLRAPIPSCAAVLINYVPRLPPSLTGTNNKSRSDSRGPRWRQFAPYPQGQTSPPISRKTENNQRTYAPKKKRSWETKRCVPQSLSSLRAERKQSLGQILPRIHASPIGRCGKGKK